MPYFMDNYNYTVNHTRVKINIVTFFFISFINVGFLQVIVEFLAGLQWSSNSVSLRVEGEGEGLVRSLRHSMILLLYPQ